MSISQIRGTIEETFEPKRNALNAVRLALALSVIVWHSFPLTGTPSPSHPVTQLLGETGVDGFFAISGFLIVSSWIRRPAWWPYLKARFLRILPAFWACLILTALVIAPIGILLAGNGFPDGYAASAIGYVLHNAGLEMTQYGIAGTPAGVPYPDVWNGSLWTLYWEFLCYLVVLALGLANLFRFKIVVPALFVLCLAGLIVTTTGLSHNVDLTNGSRFGLTFAAGALIYQWRTVIPARWWLVGVAAVIVAVSSLLPDYRVVAALPIAYGVITVGTLVKARAFRLRNDVSYGTYIYAFPVQQVLASAGLSALGVPVFAAIAIPLTLLLATASWFVVEKPAMRLKGARVVTPPPVVLAE